MNRCPSCFGTKQVRKLGNMLGDCDTCEGKGQVSDEKLAAIPKPPALPAGNATAPQTVDHYLKEEVAANKARIKNANVAYMNQPITLDPKRKNDAASSRPPMPEKPVIPLDPKIKQAPDHRLAPGPLQEHQLQKLREQIQPREVDMMASQKVIEDEQVTPADEQVEAEVQQVEPQSEPKASSKKSSNKKSKAKGIANGKQERVAAGS